MCNIVSHYTKTGMIDIKWKATASTKIQDRPQPLLTNIICDMADCSVHSHTTSAGHLKFTLRSY